VCVWRIRRGFTPPPIEFYSFGQHGVVHKTTAAKGSLDLLYLLIIWNYPELVGLFHISVSCILPDSRCIAPPLPASYPWILDTKLFGDFTFLHFVLIFLTPFTR